MQVLCLFIRYSLDIHQIFSSRDKIVPERYIEHKGDNAQYHFTTQAKKHS